jgi:hypothetical protein
MVGRATILLSILASASPIPATAQAPATTTAFDGLYQGVSHEVHRYVPASEARCQPGHPVPGPLTIRNRLIGNPGSKGWEGTVNPQGGLTMRSARTPRVDGQIDSQGTLTAQYSGPACITTFVWRKQSG